MHSAVEEALEHLRVDLCKENVRCEVTLIDGNPASEILSTIAARNIDLAILGTHAREGWERLAWAQMPNKFSKSLLPGSNHRPKSGGTVEARTAVSKSTVCSGF